MLYFGNSARFGCAECAADFSVGVCSSRHGNITAAAGSAAGLLVGGSGSELKAIIGTNLSPVEVSGSLNGTALSSENAATLLWGDGFDSTVHSINYVIK